jgi:hypothetical protein
VPVQEVSQAAGAVLMAMNEGRPSEEVAGLLERFMEVAPLMQSAGQNCDSTESNIKK